MSRPARSRIAALCLALAALTGSAVAHAEGTRISLVRVKESGPPVIEVSGEWKSGCPPQLLEVRHAGRDLTVVAEPDSQRCDGQPGPYRLLAELPASAQANEAAGVWRLRYTLRDDPLQPPRLMAFELWRLGELPAVDPESGFWWGEVGGEFDHAGPGLGVQLELQGGTLALTTSGYAADGSPEWLFGATPFSGVISDIALNRLGGGSGPFGDYAGPAEAKSAGRVQIEWLDSARAVFWFSRPDADRRGISLWPVSMVRFDFGGNPGPGWIGRWLLEIDAGAELLALEFSDLVLRKGGFTLLGRNGEAMLCEFAADRPQSPPAACEIQLADGRLLRLDDVGLSQLSGLDEASRALRLTRLAR
jgi:hypothetical protein